MQNELRIIPLRGIGEVQPGDDLVAMMMQALVDQGISLEEDDVLVVTQKIVSKAEGRIVDPATVEPSDFARTIEIQGRKSAEFQELVLRESRRIVKMDRGVLITETHHGLICANAGIDESNVAGGSIVTLLPSAPDRSAAELRAGLQSRLGLRLAVIISDTFGRPWREGQVNIAIGVAGIAPLLDYSGIADSHGFMMQASKIAIADELASAAELVMGKIDAVPVAIVRGYHYAVGDGGAQELIRDPAFDLFR